MRVKRVQTPDGDTPLRIEERKSWTREMDGQLKRDVPREFLKGSILCYENKLSRIGLTEGISWAQLELNPGAAVPAPLRGAKITSCSKPGQMKKCDASNGSHVCIWFYLLLACFPPSAFLDSFLVIHPGWQSSLHPDMQFKKHFLYATDLSCSLFLATYAVSDAQVTRMTIVISRITKRHLGTRTLFSLFT